MKEVKRKEKPQPTLKEKIREKLQKNKYEIYKCAVCGNEIFSIDINDLNFEYIESKTGGMRLIHTKCFGKEQK